MYKALVLIFLVALCGLTPASGAHTCTFGGKTYNHGQSFVPEGCSTRCHCNRWGVGCVSLCPPRRITCSPDEVESAKQEPVPDSSGRCFCNVPVCVKAPQVCVIGGKTYTAGQSFVDEVGCNLRCTCKKGGSLSCVSLCPPFGIACPPGEVKSTKKEPVANSNGRCFCTNPTCIKA